MLPENTPKPPAGDLKAKGKKAWERIWLAETVKAEDYDAILLLCKLTDERSEYEATFRKEARTLLINNNTNLVVHPLLKRIETIDKQLESLYDKLGLTPMGRAKMKIEQQGTQDPLEQLAQAWLQEDAQAKKPVEA